MDDQAQSISKNEQERILRQKSAGRRKIKKIILWVIILAAIAGGVYGFALLQKKADQNKPGVEYPNQGQAHISPGQSHEPYNSNPPTSGSHYAEAAAWGIYDKELSDEQLIHNLEHGGIWISYKDLNNQELVNKLKDIADDYSIKVIMTPRPQNDSAIAAAAWQRLLKLDSFDEKQIKSFIKAFINKGPEQVPY